MKNAFIVFLFSLIFANCSTSVAQPTPQSTSACEPEIAANIVASPYCTVVATETATAVFNANAQFLTLYESDEPAGEAEFTYHGPARVFMLDKWTITAETERGSVNLCLPTGELEVYLDGRRDVFTKPTPALITSN